MEKPDPEGIAAAYDRWSERYDFQPNATRDLDEIVLRRVVPDLSGKTVVECGCGTGKNTIWLAPRCDLLVGLDFSAGMLGIARSKTNAPNVVFVRHDLRHPWPLCLASADLVLFNLVLEHVQDLLPVFAEASSALKPGGIMVLSEYHPARVTVGKGPVVMAPDGTVEQRIPNFLHTLDDYTRAAEAAGLTPVSVGEWSEEELTPQASRGALPGDNKPQLISIVFRRGQSSA